jgi:hypothetical protein
MSVIQSTFKNDYPTRLLGAPATGELSNDITRELEGVANCAFGQPVFKGAADKGVILTVSAALVGFALRRVGQVVSGTRTADTYLPKDNVLVRERGALTADCVTAANKDQPVFITPAGKVSNAAAGNTAAAGWVFDETIAAAAAVNIIRR